jgi:hypothetical protein
MGGSTQGYDKARDAINQGMGQQQGYANQGVGYYSPFYQAGAGALPNYQNALNQGADPSSYLNNLMSQYQQSPDLQNQINAGISAANNANSASGMLGSTQASKDAASYAEGMRSQDMQNWLSHALGLRQEYLGGEQGLGQMGFNSAAGIGNIFNNLNQDIGQGYGGIGQTYVDQQAQQNNRWNSLGGLLGKGLGLAGGWALGGPAGGAAGASLFGNR